MNDETWNTAASPARRIGSAVEFHTSLGSTNDRAWQLLHAVGEGSAVVADVQTAGRGRQGRTWTSPPGVSLMVSVGLRPQLQATDAWELAAAAGLALLYACRERLGVPGEGLALKWPNDVVDEQGRKLAGVLIETSIDADVVREAVIGAGVNVNWRRADMPPAIADSATSLQELNGDRLDRVALLAAYLEALNAELIAIEAGSSPVERYAAASWLTGRDVEIIAGDRTVTGTASGIGPDGSLLIQSDDGPAAFGHGEVVRVGVREASGAPA